MRRTIMMCVVGLGALGMSSDPARAGEINNGFDTDWVFVIRGGTWESEVRKLNEAAPDPLHSDLGPFGTIADDTWPKAIKTANYDASDPQDASVIKSLCFSNSPVPGQNSPAGARLFGIYDVRALDPDGLDWNWTYQSSSFQIVELNSAGKRIRVMQVGWAAGLYGPTSLPPDQSACTWVNTHPDSLLAPCAWGPNEGEWNRHNLNGCRIGNIRYNPAKNTLCVAAVIGEWDISTQIIPKEVDPVPATDDPAYPKARVYEFELPDWPEVYYTAQNAPVPELVGQPIPQADPSVVKLVQIYEMPNPHSVVADNGRNRNEGKRPTIALDQVGNLYFTALHFDATHTPSWSGVRWEGVGAGDIVKCSTLGKNGGKNVYVVPVTGSDAGNLIVQADNQAALGHTQYAGGCGLEVRPASQQLVTVPWIECNDPLVDPNFKYVNIFDLTQTEGGAYPNELKRLKFLGNDRCDLPRKPHFAQRDELSGLIYLANIMGACDCAQNFMYVHNDYPVDTVEHDVGYFLDVINPNGSSAGNLAADWDAASPPPAPGDFEGACCVSCGGCQIVL